MNLCSKVLFNFYNSNFKLKKDLKFISNHIVLFKLYTEYLKKDNETLKSNYNKLIKIINSQKIELKFCKQIIKDQSEKIKIIKYS